MTCYVARHLSVVRPGNDLFHQQRVGASIFPTPILERTPDPSHPQQSLLSAVSTIIVFFQPPSTSPTIRLRQSCSTHPASSDCACHSRSFPEQNRQCHLFPSQTPNTNRLSSQITTTLSSTCLEPNVSPARRSAKRHQLPPLKAKTPAHTKPSSKRKAAATRLLAST